ncbi:MAG TPA: hypothetical protein VJR71_19420, partial [Pseudolabrys sp.]|nr:hypothetical protein [Pseudolabrys sp.]
MADEQTQRPYRASEPPPARSAGKSSGNDPLAELARLIGQTDPFAEFGRENARRAPAPPSERTDWNTQPLGAPHPSPFGTDPRASLSAPKYAGNEYYAPPQAAPEPPVPREYAAPGYARQSYGGATLPADADQYPPENDAHEYPSGSTDYQHEAYDDLPLDEQDYYEDAPPPRRRLGVMAIAGVLALAVVGTAGAFGYRALFGPSTSSKPPPVIKADTGPSKIVPATSGRDAQSNKLITDRVNDRGQLEKLVSREEQPLDRPAAVVLSQPVQQPPVGSGVLASEPKKVRTITIHPDQPVVADAASPAPQPAARSISAPPPARPAPPAQTARAVPDNSTADAEEQDVPPTAPSRAAPPHAAAAPASGNAPLSLNPNAAPSRTAAPPPARTASLPPQTAPAGAGGSFVQVSSQRSEAEAQAAFRGLQAKFPNQLGGRQPVIHKVDLGAKG